MSISGNAEAAQNRIYRSENTCKTESDNYMPKNRSNVQ